MSLKMNWNDIDENEIELVIFNAHERIKSLKFLAYIGNEQKETKFGKKVQHNWTVLDLDTNTEKRFNGFEGSRLLKKLKPFSPLIGKSLKITKIFFVDQTKNTFEVEAITLQTKLDKK